MQKNNKNILIINSGGFKGGGTENRIKSIIKKILVYSIFNQIYFIGKKNKYIFKETKRLKVYFYSYKLKSLIDIICLVKKNKLDIVQIHNLNFYQVLSLIYVYIKKIPIIFFLHDYWPICAYKNFMNPYEKKIAELCYGKKCISCIGIKNYIKQKIIKLILNKTVTIGIASGKTSIDVCEKFNFLKNKWEIVIPWIKKEYLIVKNFSKKNNNEKKKIFFIGSLLAYKGFWVLESSLKILKINNNIELYIIGSDQTEKEKNKIISQINNPKIRYNFLGKVCGKKLIDLLKEADLLIFSSVWPEIFGQVWAEALALKVPVLVSKIGGAVDYIKNDFFLFEPGNHIELANKIEKILNQNNNIEIDELYNFVIDNFNIEKAFDKISNIYKGLQYLKENTNTNLQKK